ncbi:MAG: SHOCT domain-containing protein [Desulforhopalus sp.]
MIGTGFGSGFGHYGNWLCGPGAFFHGPLGWVITLLFWALVIYLVIKLFQTLFKGGKRASAGHLDRLKERYVQGEINEEEYRRMKSELS